MPRGPEGEKRLADVVGNGVHVMRVATEIEESTREESAAAALGRRGGLKCGKARAAKTAWTSNRPLAASDAG